MKLISYKLNQIGGRKNVEDTIMPKAYKDGDPNVFVVCDGVGGSNFGEVASDIASSIFYQTMAERINDVPSQFAKIVQQTVVKFKSQVEQHIAENPAAHGTSTTLTLAVVIGNKAYVAWCGDSRIYQVRNGVVKFRSKDHSLVFELISQGIITEEQAATHPQRNVITRSLNSQTKPSDVETAILNLESSDWLLLCTDGLLEQFKESKFDIHLNGYKSSLDYADYINKMCENRTSDNYSMYLLYCNAGFMAKSWKYLVTLVLLIALGYGGFKNTQGKDAVGSPTKDVQSTTRTTPLIVPTPSKSTDSAKQTGKEKSLNNLVK